MIRLDGRFIKPGSIPADRLDPSIPIGGSGGVPDGSVTPAKLAVALLRRFVAVTWGAALFINPQTRVVTIQIRDFLNNPIRTAHVLRITCDDQAKLSVGDHGGAFSGSDSPDLIAQTDDTGRLDLVVSCPVQASVTLAAGPTQGSPLLDASATVDVSFN